MLCQVLEGFSASEGLLLFESLYKAMGSWSCGPCWVSQTLFYNEHHGTSSTTTATATTSEYRDSILYFTI